MNLTREQRDAYITSVLSQYHRVEEGHPEPCPECEDIVGLVLMIEQNVRAEQAAEVERLTRERDLAVAHDRQPYPTAWAYEQVCKSLRETKLEVERLRALEAPPVIRGGFR